MRNSNSNTDAWADGYRFRLEIFGSVANRLAPEFVRTKADAKRRKEELLAAADIRAKVFEITEDGSLRFARA